MNRYFVAVHIISSSGAKILGSINFLANDLDKALSHTREVYSDREEVNSYIITSIYSEPAKMDIETKKWS